MSDLPEGFSPIDTQIAVFIPYARSIGGIIAEVTIEEQHRDDITITEHPVEQGAPIADHAFKRPPEVIIRVGWSQAKSGDLSDKGKYGELLAWQASFNPFVLYTGKRKYEYMLIQNISVSTDESLEYSLIATLACRQVIIVSTKTTTATGISTNPANNADPSATTPKVETGPQQTRSASSAEEARVNAEVLASTTELDRINKQEAESHF